MRLLHKLLNGPICSFLWIVSLAGCSSSSPPIQNGSGSGRLEIGLQIVGGSPSNAPTAIRVVFTNTSSAPVTFVEPRPRCVESESDELTLLGLTLTDAAQGDCVHRRRRWHLRRAG